MDLRTLIKSEEEVNQTKHFTRLFPTATSHKYFKYFYNGIPYYDKLLDAWEAKYANNRAKGIKKLRKFCNKGIHASPQLGTTSAQVIKPLTLSLIRRHR